jgi:hypothetical protein
MFKLFTTRTISYHNWAKAIVTIVLSFVALPSFCQYSMSEFFKLTKQEAKQNLDGSGTLIFLMEGESTLMYMIDPQKTSRRSLVSDEFLILSFTSNKCDKVGLVYKKEHMNKFIKLFNERFVQKGEYNWIDYAGQTRWELIRLEESTIELKDGPASWEGFFTLLATPL